MNESYRTVLVYFALIASVFVFSHTVRNALARPDGDIPLIAATLRGDLQSVHALLGAGADPNLHDLFRNTALIYAARDGMTEIARALLKSGADPGWVDDERVTPLILASFKGHQAIVALLLAYEIDREHRDQWGRSALDYALRRGLTDPIAQLLRMPGG